MTDTTTTRNKRGRPVKPAGEARTISLPPVRVNPAEDSHIQMMASQAGLPVSSYVRRAALNAKISLPKSEIDDKILFELSRACANHYQVMRHLNFGQGVPNDIAEVIDELRAVVAKVGAAYDA